MVARCNLPKCPRATLIEASERDYRIALATDATSRISEQGLRELAGIGTVLLTTKTISENLRHRAGRPPRRKNGPRWPRTRH